MRLELTRRGDYAVRAMLTLSRPNAGWQTAAELARRTAIPPSFVPHVMRDLVRAGHVANRLGRRGGYAIAGDPATISLLDIVEAVEGDSRRRTCVMRGGPCGRGGTVCDVHHAFASAQEAATEKLGSVMLADVAASRD